MNVKKTLHIPIINEGEEKVRSEFEIPITFTSKIDSGKHKEKITSALKRFLKSSNVKQQQLAELMCVTSSIVSSYMTGRRRIIPDHLHAFCIALRLSPNKQRYLHHILGWKMPDENGNGEDSRETIIRRYLDFCSCHKNMNVKSCNDELIRSKYWPLTEKAMRGKRL